MDPACSQFLARLLQELGPPSSSSRMTFPDLCTSLCARFDLLHLLKIRSLLFHTASVDPAFPATLLQDRMFYSSEEDPQQKKLMVATDIVAMLKLIQMDGEEQAVELHRDTAFMYDHGHRHDDCQPLQPPTPTSCECNQFLHSSDPNFLLKRGAPPQDQQAGSGPAPLPDPQGSYCLTDSESATDQESLQPALQSYINRRNLLKVSPQVMTSDWKQTSKAADEVITRDWKQTSKAADEVITRDWKQTSKAADEVITRDWKQTSKADGCLWRDMQKSPTFFNHSFDLPYSNPYFEPAVPSPLQDRLRVKHESLDDLQASTYFGPTTASDHISRRLVNRAGRPPVWPVKSLSLNTEEALSSIQRPLLKTKPLQESRQCSISIISTEDRQFHHPNHKVLDSPGLVKKGDVGLMVRPDQRCKDKSLMGDCTSSVGTQTEQVEQKKTRDPSRSKDRERHQLKQSDEDTDMVSDNISDIFRFLDDMSVCDSLGIVRSSCHNSTASLSQGTLKSDGDSSPERHTVKLVKSKMDRLFHSLENSDDELKLSVCKLVMRIGEIEKKLESLSGVRGEISEVLSKLNKLDKKIQEPKDPETQEQQQEKMLASGSNATPEDPQPPSSSLPAHMFQCHTTGHNRRMDLGLTGGWAPVDQADSLRMKALKRSMFTARSSRSLNEENSATESKIASITNSPCDWRIASCRPLDDSVDAARELQSKALDRHRKAKQAGRDHQSQRPPKPAKTPYLIQQVFSPQPSSPSVKTSTKDGILYTNLRLSSQPSWTIQEHHRHPGQKVQDPLDPNDLEFWMEDVSTPGFDSLLKRKELELRRTKACKIAALIAAAACTVVLVIVVPICTMKS